MASNRNALAELAEFLKGESGESSAEFKAKAIEKFGEAAWNRHEERKRKFGRAARIIAELAKVSTLGPKHIPGDISLYKAYAECRAIAEEGANYER